MAVSMKSIACSSLLHPERATRSVSWVIMSIAAPRREGLSIGSFASGLRGPKCVFLKGNHEDMFLGFLGLGGRHGDSFLWNGGDMTLASYGIDERLGHLVLERLPETHRQFLLDLETYRCLGAFLCVHAGVRPTRSLEDQMEEDLFWIREDFILNEHPLPYTVLYGHTPNQGVRLDLPHKIGLDTGLVYGNLLSCLELRDRELLQIQRGGRDVRRRSLAEDFARAGVGVA